ncbi:MAG: hypothetical protein JST16_16895 [Bdellovibrionales bacterium]|nr:hypothetical protein [Bdellovibrionales bacterium]
MKFTNYVALSGMLSALASVASYAQEDFGSYGRSLGAFRNTWYCLALESDYPSSPKDQRLLDRQDKVLATVHEGFRKDLRIEGSGKLLDGRVLNFAELRGNEHRYRTTTNPFGDGVGTCALVPFHTIAVDPQRIPLGSVVRIPETVGMKLPDGSVHNGLWKAEDIGSAIKNDRIDLFVGAGERNGRYLEAYGIKNMQALTVELVQEPTDDSCVYQAAPVQPQL